MPPRYRYEQIADDLAERIKSGEFPPCSKLPSRRELIEHYGVTERSGRGLVSVAQRCPMVGLLLWLLGRLLDTPTRQVRPRRGRSQSLRSSRLITRLMAASGHSLERVFALPGGLALWTAPAVSNVGDGVVAGPLLVFQLDPSPRSASPRGRRT
ncbi:GntR family transcriptional regulator [Micromonospora sp. NPDC023737]|uniref:GntR family transcriptional regulator n=1 Tax=unclassified Micromonospora TaxID=2617518 RepID=UPI00340D9526